jgi:hypothetical protein
MPPKTYTVTWRKLTETEFHSQEFESLDEAVGHAKLQIQEESDGSMFGYEVRIITMKP